MTSRPAHRLARSGRRIFMHRKRLAPTPKALVLLSRFFRTHLVSGELNRRFERTLGADGSGWRSLAFSFSFVGVDRAFESTGVFFSLIDRNMGLKPNARVLPIDASARKPLGVFCSCFFAPRSYRGPRARFEACDSKMRFAPFSFPGFQTSSAFVPCGWFVPAARCQGYARVACGSRLLLYRSPRRASTTSGRE